MAKPLGARVAEERLRAERAEAEVRALTARLDATDLCLLAEHDHLIIKAWALDIDELRGLVASTGVAGRWRSRLLRQLDELRIARATTADPTHADDCFEWVAATGTCDCHEAATAGPTSQTDGDGGTDAD